MDILPLTTEDLKEVVHLQPDVWPAILQSVQQYCILDFCFPMKAVMGNNLVGIGTAIFHKQSAWLGHIIVHKDYRNQGIGTKITRSLIDFVQKRQIKSILLIATAMGERIYKKLGFEIETQYQFLENGFLSPQVSLQIRPFENQHESPLLALDQMISGENRRASLNPHLAKGRVYVEDGMLRGFYLPTLGEGLILADTVDAGLALLINRYTDQKNVCLPVDNEAAISMLVKSSFTEVRLASRMILGERFFWSPAKMYSRIGGNLG